MFSFLLRACGVLIPRKLEDDEHRFVLSISVERFGDEKDDDDAENSPPPQEERSWFNQWLNRWALSTFKGVIPGFTSGGICTQSLMAVLKANKAHREWQSLEIGNLLNQMGGVLNRQHETASVFIRGSSRIEDRPLGSVWTETAPVRRALLVGLCYTDSELELKGSWNDVDDIQSWLESENLCTRSEIRTLVDKPTGNASPYVTREEILVNLRWLMRRSDQPAQLFFHFSGHGDGKKLLPSDPHDDPIRDFELSEMINDLLPKNATLTCIFDCCDGTKMLESLLKAEHTLAFGTTSNMFVRR